MTLTPLHIAQAYNAGAAHARTHETPSEAPLSGEWAGDPTPLSVAVYVGLKGDELEDYDLLEEIADEFEAGYYAVFEAA